MERTCLVTANVVLPRWGAGGANSASLNPYLDLRDYFEAEEEGENGMEGEKKRREVMEKLEKTHSQKYTYDHGLEFIDHLRR